jgi:hypothetical protein
VVFAKGFEVVILLILRGHSDKSLALLHLILSSWTPALRGVGRPHR